MIIPIPVVMILVIFYDVDGIFAQITLIGVAIAGTCYGLVKGRKKKVQGTK